MTQRQPGRGAVHRERGWERRLVADRRNGERRHRAVLVELDRRSGVDRRVRERRKK